MKNTRGFTLIEMVVVVVIIGIITIFSVPYFGGFAKRSKLDSACRLWVAYAKYTRNEAVMTGIKYRLTCDLDQQHYWLTHEDLPAGYAGQYVAVNGDWGKPVAIEEPIKMTSIQVGLNPAQEAGLVAITFTPRGT
jgi:prepilin-type N-terminal cleavage/methylation domain-containing protein